MNDFIINVFKISFLIIFILTQVSCGSFQPVSSYSDGIYSSDNVIVIRKSDLDNDSNSYSRYFDQVARQYDWDDRRSDIVLSDIDSINSNSIDNYKTNPQWGGGQKTTQIFMFNNNLGAFQNFYNPFGLGFNSPFWSLNSPYFNGWGWGNPMRRWNRLGFRGWNHWGWNYGWNGNFGFYNPWFPAWFPGGNPYWGFSPYNYFNSPYVGNYGVRSSSQFDRVRGWAYSSTYRGKNTGPANSNFRARSGEAQSNNVRSTSYSSIPDLVSEGRRVAQNNNSEQRSVNSNSDAQRRRIETIIRQYQSRGYNVELMPTRGNSNVYRLRISENYGYQARDYQGVNNSIFGNNSSSQNNNSSGKTNRRYNSSGNSSGNYSSSSGGNSYSSPSRGSYNASRGSSYGSSSISRSSGRSSTSRSSGRKQ